MKKIIFLTLMLLIFNVSSNAQEEEEFEAEGIEDIAGEEEFEEEFDEGEDFDEEFDAEETGDIDPDIVGTEDLEEIEEALDQLGAEDDAELGEEEAIQEEFEESDLEAEATQVEFEEPELEEEAVQEEFEEEEEFSVSETESSGFEDDVTGELVDITNVEFDGNQDGGTIIISLNGQASYSTRMTDSGKQVVVEIENTRLPDRFKRPYDTKEFSSNIGLFQGYQSSGSNISRFVIQLREDISPSISQNGNQIIISAQGGGSSLEDQEFQDQPNEESFADSPAQNFDDSALIQQTEGQKVSRFYGHEISIELRNSPIVDAIRLIIEESGANILMSNIPTTPVTFKLRNVPWDQALHIVMDSNGLGYSRQGDVIVIKPLSDMERDLRAEANFKKQQADAQKQKEEAEEKIEDLGPIDEDVIPIFNSNAQDVAAAINTLKGLTEKGTIHVLEDNNSLIIKDSIKKISEIRKLIKDKIDKPALQVLIEGKIVEVNERFGSFFGLDLTNQQQTTTPGAPATAPNPSFALPYGPGGAEGIAGTNIGLTITNIPAINIGNLSARLGFEESRGFARVLASPRVVALNNRQATISQTNRYSIEKTVTTDTDTSTSYEFRDLPLSLDVKPIISADGVTMTITLTRTYKTGAGEGAEEFERQINTEVFVKHGDTTVIGGIYTSNRDESNTGVPFLSRVPILGFLFKRSIFTSDRNELMVFLSPTIINRDASIGLSLDSQDSELIDEELVEEF